MLKKSTILSRISALMLALIFMTGSFSVNAQVTNLAFSSSVGTYTEITGGTLVASAIPSATSADWLDDVTYAAQPIPFVFNFNGVNYSAFNINTNGFITFGDNVTNSYSPISATTAYAGVIAAIANDLDGRFTTQANTTLGSNTLTGVLHFGGVVVGKGITGTNIPAGTTVTAFDAGAQTITLSQAATATTALVTVIVYSADIRTQTLGSAPNRIHVIQIKNFKRYGAGSTLYNGELVNYQIRLHETTNNIEIVYGNVIVTATAARTSQVGLRGAANTDFSNRMTVLPHNWTATTAGTLNSSTCSFLNTGFPPIGLTFLYATPPPPAYGNVAGIVTDAATGDPVIGAHVMTGDLSITTLANGAYLFEELVAGPNTITVHKTGYSTLNQVVNIVGGQTLNQDLMLMESANVPGPVLAELNTGATAVNLTWGLPQGQYEIIYDDGVADNVTAWGLSGNMNALRFTPAGYPAKIIAGSVNIYDGTYPPAGNALVPFQMAVYDATGPNGYPGNELGIVSVTPNATGWVNFDLSDENITIASGDFYLVMIQGGNFPNCAPIAIDNTNPVMRSYSRFVTGNAPWTPAGFNDFMMRAIVEGPGGPSFLGYGAGELLESGWASKGAMSLYEPKRAIAEVGMGIFKPIAGTGLFDRNVEGYRVFRFVEGQEGNEAAWTLLGNPATTAAVDNSWPSLPDGAFRWAVKAKYPGDVFSAPTFSNILRKNWASNVTINITLSDPEASIAGTEVTLANNAFPQYTYSAIADATGMVNFPEVWKGSYTLSVMLFGYDPYTSQESIMTNTFTKNVTLMETTNPPSNLVVNPVTLMATWSVPTSFTEFFVDFNSGIPSDWTVVNGGACAATFVGVANYGGSSTLDGTPFVIADSDGAGSTCGMMDEQLISPPVNTLGLSTVILEFDQYYRALSDIADVDVWNGSSWVNVLRQTTTSGAWGAPNHRVINITAHSNAALQVRFHYYNADWAWYWGIDNVKISDGTRSDRSVIGYYVYLDNVLAGFTEDAFFQFQPEYIEYGQTYTAGVRAVYQSGFAPQVNYTFSSMFR